MKTHEIRQGSDAWHEFRLSHKGASEAAAMLGLSKKVSRLELLRAKHTGIAREFSDFVQTRILDKGHEVEALARPHVEKTVGAELFPVTVSDGSLSASCDGLDLMGEIAFEHKQWNEELAASVRAGVVPDYHMPQCQQVLMVSRADRLIFVVSDGTPERMVWCWVYPNHDWFQRIRDGWAQFDRDLAAYVLPQATEPEPVGKAPESLPALLIEVTGKVTASNLAEFKETALSAIRSVNRTLKTDQDFADAAKAVKWCSDVEERLQAAKEHALSQTSSIDALFKAIDDISAEARRVRLDLDKLVTRRKTEVKEEAVTAARVLLDRHIADLNGEIAPMRLQPVPADFAAAIKGLRSFDSMQGALDAAVASAKIAADRQALGIRANVATFKAKTGDDTALQALFADLSTIVHKAADDFTTLADARIAKHRADEAEKEAKRKAAEDARVAAAEAQARADEAARIQREQAAAAAPAPAPAPAAAPAPITRLTAIPEAGVTIATRTAPAPRADEPATLKLGAIAQRLGFALQAEFISTTLGISPAKAEGSAKLYRESDFDRICERLVTRIRTVQAERTLEMA